MFIFNCLGKLAQPSWRFYSFWIEAWRSKLELVKRACGISWFGSKSVRDQPRRRAGMAKGRARCGDRTVGKWRIIYPRDAEEIEGNEIDQFVRFSKIFLFFLRSAYLLAVAKYSR